ncbi:hypothetical protein B484DRAFT_394679 [Ochromonadaceae sp. CCMP2298]|nr:hypothetical protein B484DRAFT_394679 [Ochromonadaceae sp. CCMP2298]
MKYLNAGQNSRRVGGYPPRVDLEFNMEGEAARKTAIKRDIDPSTVAPPSKRSVMRWEERFSVNTGNAETTTNARAVACANIKNTVSYTAMNKYVM